jgi:glycogen operon protein
MTAFRRAHPVLSEERFYTDADVRWFDPQLRVPNWADPGAKQLGCLIREGDGGALYLMFNASTEPAAFRVPAALNGGQWHIAVDTGREWPHDLFAPGEEPPVDPAQPYAMTPRCSAILLWRKDRILHEDKQTPTYATEQSRSAILARPNSSRLRCD